MHEDGNRPLPVRFKKLGREGLRHVFLLGLTTIGFPASMAALTWVNDLVGKPRRNKRVK